MEESPPSLSSLSSICMLSLFLWENHSYQSKNFKVLFFLTYGLIVDYLTIILNMVITCIVLGCSNTYGMYNQRKFHRFPKNPALRLLWLQGINRIDPKDHWRVCSDHFAPSDYKFDTLKPDAVPTLNQSPKIQRGSKCECVHTTQSVELLANVNKEVEINALAGPSFLAMSDVDEQVLRNKTTAESSSHPLSCKFEEDIELVSDTSLKETFTTEGTQTSSLKKIVQLGPRNAKLNKKVKKLICSMEGTQTLSQKKIVKHDPRKAKLKKKVKILQRCLRLIHQSFKRKIG